MFRSSTIIRELALNLPKFIFMLKHSVKLRRYLLCGELYIYQNARCNNKNYTKYILKNEDRRK